MEVGEGGGRQGGISAASELWDFHTAVHVAMATARKARAPLSPNLRGVTYRDGVFLELLFAW